MCIRDSFETLLPIASKEAKEASKPSQEKAVFKLVSNGIVTARDEWMTDFSASSLEKKTRWFCDVYSSETSRWRSVSASQPKDANKRAEALRNFVSREIKWTEVLENHLERGTALKFDATRLRPTTA